MEEARSAEKAQRSRGFTGLKLPWKTEGGNRCPICGEVIAGQGVVRYGKRFCRSWHADFYRPPLPWWRRLRWPDDDGGGGGGGCCG